MICFVTAQSSFELNLLHSGTPLLIGSLSFHRVNTVHVVQLIYLASSSCPEVLGVPFSSQFDARNQIPVSTCHSLLWLLSYYAVLGGFFFQNNSSESESILSRLCQYASQWGTVHWDHNISAPIDVVIPVDNSVQISYDFYIVWMGLHLCTLQFSALSADNASVTFLWFQSLYSSDYKLVDGWIRCILTPCLMLGPDAILSNLIFWGLQTLLGLYGQSKARCSDVLNLGSLGRPPILTGLSNLHIEYICQCGVEVVVSGLTVGAYQSKETPDTLLRPRSRSCTYCLHHLPHCV